MSALVPRAYGNYPAQVRYYPDQRGMQMTHWSPAASQPFYGSALNTIHGYPANELNRSSKGSFGEHFIGWVNRLDSQYRHEQYLKQQNKIERRYWKDQANRLPPAMYTMAKPPGYLETTPPSMYHYEQEIRYVPFPVYITPTGATGRRGNPVIPGEITTLPFSVSTTTTLLGAGNTMSLPPKIRVIFIPTGSSPMQQPYMGPLTMPPFLFSRMAQPLCSLPLPPPLPQVASLPLTPGIQEMVMQRYVNPVAVLPFNASYQMPQPMLPLYQSMPQQAPIMPAPVFQPAPSVPQVYMPPALPPQMPQPVPMMPAPVFQPVPSVPQSYMPPALPPQMPQPVPMMPAPVFQPAPSVPQSYMPPALPPPMPVMSVFPPPPPVLAAPPMMQPQPPAPVPQALPPAPPAYFPPPSSAAPSYMGYSPPATFTGNYSTLGYSSTCRACPPAPPSLNIPVTGHCWVQHCAACHQVPMPIDHPNARPNNGRITPLLRHPTVPQYIPDQSAQSSRTYAHANPPELMRPWLRKTPPLPPGAILISDEYLDRRSYHKQRRHRSSARREDRSNHSRQQERSATVTSGTATNSAVGRSTQSKSPMVPKVTADKQSKARAPKPVEPIKVRNASSHTSTSESDGSSTQYEKVTVTKSEPRENSIPKQLAGEARNVNLRYNYPAQELPSVYLNNPYIKSSSDGSSLFSSTVSQSPSFSTSSKTTTEEALSIKEEEKVKGLPPLPPLPPKPAKTSRIFIREYATTSPSMMSTNSSLLSDVAFSVVGRRKESDATSTTSTIKAVRLADEIEQKSKS